MTTARTELLARCFGWLEANLPSFAPFDAATVHGDRLKAVCDLSVLCGQIRGSAAAAHGTALEAFVDRIAAVLYDERSVVLLERANEFRLLQITAYGHLRMRGRDDRTFRGRVRRLINSGMPGARESGPTGIMAMRHALDTAHLRHALPPMRTLVRRSLLHQGPSVIGLTREESYWLTHAAFYASDFGRRTADIDEGSADVLEALLDLSLRRRDWDLVAESLLATWCVARRPILRATAWEALADVQASDGSVPTIPSRETGDDFLDRHHPTIVTALAAALVDEA